jgi:hypothetical protein
MSRPLDLLPPRDPRVLVDAFMLDGVVMVEKPGPLPPRIEATSCGTCPLCHYDECYGSYCHVDKEQRAAAYPPNPPPYWCKLLDGDIVVGLASEVQR